MGAGFYPPDWVRLGRCRHRLPGRAWRGPAGGRESWRGRHRDRSGPARQDWGGRRRRRGRRGRPSGRRRGAGIGGKGARAGSWGSGRLGLGRRLGGGHRCGQDWFWRVGLLVVSNKSDVAAELVAIVVQWFQIQFPDADHGWIVAHIEQEPDQRVFRRLDD